MRLKIEFNYFSSFTEKAIIDFSFWVVKGGGLCPRIIPTCKGKKGPLMSWKLQFGSALHNVDSRAHTGWKLLEFSNVSQIIKMSILVQASDIFKDLIVLLELLPSYLLSSVFKKVNGIFRKISPSVGLEARASYSKLPTFVCIGRKYCPKKGPSHHTHI